MHHNDFSRVAAHRRAAEYYRRLRLPQQDWQNLRDLEPILFEFDHLLSAGDYDYACSLVDEVDVYYLSRWGHTERLLSMRRSLLGRISDTRLATQNLIGLGRAYTGLGDSKESVDYLRQALLISRRQNLRFEEGIALGSLAPAYFDLGEYDKAIECYEDSILIAREGDGDLLGESLRLGGLAVVYRELGEFHLAIECLQNAINVILKQKPKGRSTMGTHLKNLGDIHRLLAKYGEAEDCFREALDISKEEIRKSSRAEHEALSGIGSIYEDNGEFRRAHDLADQALRITIAIHERDSEGYKRRDIGRLQVALGNLETGTENLTAALHIADDLKIPRLKHFAGLDLAWAYLVSGQIEDAWRSMQRALEFMVPRNAPAAHALMGIVFTRQRQLDLARSEFEEAVLAADSLLAKTENYYAALYAKALSLAGMCLLGSQSMNKIHVEEVAASVQSCLDHCSAPGVIKNAINLWNMLEPFDTHQVLSGSRSLLLSKT